MRLYHCAVTVASFLCLSLACGCGGCGDPDGDLGDDEDDDADGDAVYVAKPSAPIDGDDPDPGLEPTAIHTKLLFIDDHHVSSRDGLARAIGRVRKENGGLPVLVADEEWEHPIRFGFYTSVVFNDALGKYQLWYMAQANEHRDMMERESPSSAVGYAESDDGINWTKPPVGLPQADLQVLDGPAQPPGVTTNIIAAGWHGFTVLLDPNVAEGEAERYKAAFDNELVGDSLAWLAHSSDGINFTPYVDAPVIGRASDTANQIQWDPIRATYIMVTREDLAGDVAEGEVRGSRIEERSSAAAIADAPMDWQTRAVLALDEGGLMTQSDRRQIHATLVYPYADLYLGLVFAMEHNLAAGPVQGDVDLDRRPEERVQNAYLVPSRDGINWDYSWVYAGEDQALLPRGPDGAWDQGQIHSVNLVDRGDRQLLFYNGSVERFGHGDSLAVMAIGLASLRRDGFVALEAASTGRLVTEPIVMDGDALQLNIDARQGSVCVTLLDVQGAALAGYDSCDSASGIDALRYEPTWNGSASLAALAGQTLRVEVTLQAARLYAIEVVSLR